jgi:magnesium chelatase subunit I
MGKIQVGLFNILQEGDVQIKGFPIRLPLDLMMAFSANPEDYTARGKIVTPLKDRIGSEIRTHYPAAVEDGVAITRQESWSERGAGAPAVVVPDYIRAVVEQIAFVAREDSRIDKRSGVSQRLPISCLENTISNAERRALACGENVAVPRIADIYAALPSITGKFELEYEGELRGADVVAHELIRMAVARVYDEKAQRQLSKQIVRWFELGGSLKLAESQSAAAMIKQFEPIQGLLEAAAAWAPDGCDAPPALASAGEFVLDGLYAHRKLTRSEQIGYAAPPQKSPKKAQRRREFQVEDFGETYN